MNSEVPWRTVIGKSVAVRAAFGDVTNKQARERTKNQRDWASSTPILAPIPARIWRIVERQFELVARPGQGRLPKSIIRDGPRQSGQRSLDQPDLGRFRTAR